jgi:hypothetical protein
MSAKANDIVVVPVLDHQTGASWVSGLFLVERIETDGHVSNAILLDSGSFRRVAPCAALLIKITPEDQLYSSLRYLFF